MTLDQFEELCDRVFTERLPNVSHEDGDAALQLVGSVFAGLESVALSTGVEVCQRAAYLLVFARYDMHLYEHREELGLPNDYFTADDRAAEEEAFAYLHERRCGAPARHVFSSNAGVTVH